MDNRNIHYYDQNGEFIEWSRNLEAAVGDVVHPFQKSNNGSAIDLMLSPFPSVSREYKQVNWKVLKIDDSEPLCRKFTVEMLEDSLI